MIKMKNLKLLFALYGILLIGCQKETENPAQEKEIFCLDDEFKTDVEMIRPDKELVTEQIQLTGNIQPNLDQVIHFVSLVDGIISKTNFSLGEHVTKGQVLAEMKSAELSLLQAELKKLEAQIEKAKMDLAAKEQMFEDGISSNLDIVEARSNLSILQSEKEKIHQNLSLFSASSQKNVFQIKAPSTGIITAKHINVGSTISAEGETLFSISNLDNVWAMVNIYATDIVNVQTGMEVAIKTLSYPDEIFEGKIDLISQVLDENSKVLKARIVLKNESLKLKPGMIIDVIAFKRLNEEAFAIPSSSIVFFNNQNYVLVHHNDCEIEARKIDIITSTGETTYVREGINENEKIISKNQLLIFEELEI